MIGDGCIGILETIRDIKRVKRGKVLDNLLSKLKSLKDVVRTTFYMTLKALNI